MVEDIHNYMSVNEISRVGHSVTTKCLALYLRGGYRIHMCYEGDWVVGLLGVQGFIWLLLSLGEMKNKDKK